MPSAKRFSHLFLQLLDLLNVGWMPVTAAALLPLDRVQLILKVVVLFAQLLNCLLQSSNPSVIRAVHHALGNANLEILLPQVFIAANQGS